MKFQCRMEDFFANSSGRAGRNRIFGDIFAPSSLFAIRQSASTRGREGEEKTKKEGEGRRKKKKERKLMEKYGDPPLRIGHRIILDLLMQFS